MNMLYQKAKEVALRKDIEHFPLFGNTSLLCAAKPGLGTLILFQVAGRSTGQSPHATLNASNEEIKNNLSRLLVKRF